MNFQYCDDFVLRIKKRIVLALFAFPLLITLFSTVMFYTLMLLGQSYTTRFIAFGPIWLESSFQIIYGQSQAVSDPMQTLLISIFLALFYSVLFCSLLVAAYISGQVLSFYMYQARQNNLFSRKSSR